MLTTKHALTMGRKSKQAGSGHLPLTNHEIKTYSREDAYGTTTARLDRASQHNFGDCSLSLCPALDQPVCTPSGYIYERPAILTYLLTKTQQLKEEHRNHEKWRAEQERAEEVVAAKKRAAEVATFEALNRGVQDSSILSQKKKQKSENSNENSLKVTSYWLADSQPLQKTVAASTAGGKRGGGGDIEVDTELALVVREMEPALPPERPLSPNSGQPLRRKDLIDLQLKRNSDGHVVCAVSEKSITSQRAVALVTAKPSKSSDTSSDDGAGAYVILKQVYDDLSIDQEKICPVSGKKIRRVVELQKGGSSFATNDVSTIEAKQYRPTMT